ncbi:MAG: ABC transporter ATP-binding protein [Azonexus sp.]
MNETIIEVTDLCFDYPGHRALSGISLRLEAGSVTALVGPNGAGKTTLLRCIAALDNPVAGEVRVGGLDVHAQPRQAHRLMGYLSDNFGLYGDLSVARCLSYAASAQGLAAAEVPAAVELTARRLGLQDKLEQLVRTLSRGQRQRVAIAQAIIHAPRVLLLDEPASGLDPEARSSLAAVFRTLQGEGMTLLVSSHILAELDEYSTHMLALDSGHILEHRELAKGAALAVGSGRWLRLEFAEGIAEAVAWLEQQAGIGLGSQDAGGLDIHFTGLAADQARLVAACVQAGHALTVIAPVSENLQQSYLKSLAAGRQARAGGRS